MCELNETWTEYMLLLACFLLASVSFIFSPILLKRKYFTTTVQCWGEFLLPIFFSSEHFKSKQKMLLLCKPWSQLLGGWHINYHEIRHLPWRCNWFTCACKLFRAVVFVHYLPQWHQGGKLSTWCCNSKENNNQLCVCLHIGCIHSCRTKHYSLPACWRL